MFTILTNDTLSEGFNFADAEQPSSSQRLPTEPAPTPIVSPEVAKTEQKPSPQSIFCTKVAKAASFLDSNTKSKKATDLCFSQEFNSLSNEGKITVVKEFQMSSAERENFLKVRTAILQLEKLRMEALGQVKDIHYPGFGTLRAEEQISPHYNHPFIGKIVPQLLQQEDVLFLEEAVMTPASAPQDASTFFLAMAQAAWSLPTERRIEIAFEMSLDHEFNQLDPSKRLEILKGFGMSEQEYERFRSKRQKVLFLEADRIKGIEKIRTAENLAKKTSQFFSTEGLIRACNHQHHHAFIGKIDPQWITKARMQEDYDMLTKLHQHIVSRPEHPTQPSYTQMAMNLPSYVGSYFSYWNPFSWKG